MLCPFCSEDIQDSAIVCKFCRRDITVSKPVLEENARLKAEISEARNEMARLQSKLIALGYRIGEGNNSNLLSSGSFILIWAFVTVSSVLIVHYIVQIRWDLSAVPTYVICAVAAISCGVGLGSRGTVGLLASIWIGMFVAIASVAAVSAVVALYYHQPFFPADARVGQDTIEFAVSIWLGVVGGVRLGTAFHRIDIQQSGWARYSTELIEAIVVNVDEKDKGDRIKALTKLFTAIGTVGTLVASILSAIKAGMSG
jgi:hypothetical protein